MTFHSVLPSTILEAIVTLIINTNNGTASAPGSNIGDVTFSGNVGGTAIGSINISGANDVTISDTILTSAGSVAITSDTVELDGGAITTTIASRWLSIMMILLFLVLSMMPPMILH